jgi:hypothetical protein
MSRTAGRSVNKLVLQRMRPCHGIGGRHADSDCVRGRRQFTVAHNVEVVIVRRDRERYNRQDVEKVGRGDEIRFSKAAARVVHSMQVLDQQVGAMAWVCDARTLCCTPESNARRFDNAPGRIATGIPCVELPLMNSMPWLGGPTFVEQATGNPCGNGFSNGSLVRHTAFLQRVQHAL